MDKLKEFILSQLLEKRIDRLRAKELLLEVNGRGEAGDVAIIGLAGRFSAARDEREFWDFLRAGNSTIRDFPSVRKDDAHGIFRNPYHAELILGSEVKDGNFEGLFAPAGYMDRIDAFDADYFGIPPLEATYMDPHQRVALEVAYEALENAGYGGGAVKGTRTGVFIGRDQTNYSYYRMFSERHPMQLSGSWEGLVASRISYLLDLKGPCLMTDTACSAGAVTIHQAVRSLAAGECDLAIAGGINLSTCGEVGDAYSAGAAMSSVVSRINTVRTFDARADGTLWSEGVGLVLLKPLARALADGDNIRAVIRGSAVNNDGTSSSITAPNAHMQESVILDAWGQAGVEPETITYIEAHGTGTVLGDPIELKGLTGAFRRHTTRRQFCGIGSLKTTMGHMVAASGAAAVIKVVKSLESATLAPSGNFEVPNPYIDFSDSPLYVNDRLTPWERGAEPRRAGVSSFGFIRTNCHILIEEGPGYCAAPTASEHHLFTVSAKSQEALTELLDLYQRALVDHDFSLADVCFTAGIGRAHLEHRVAIVARSMQELREGIETLCRQGLDARGAGLFHGVHAVVSDRKKELAPGDVTATGRKRLSERAQTRLTRHLADRDVTALCDVAEAYVRGAEVDIRAVYAGESRRRVPLPTYPFARTRYWAPVFQTKVTSVAAPVRHPLLGDEVHRGRTCVVFENTLSVERHWELDDHRINERAVVPGTTYIEMARAAFAAFEGPGAVRMSNVMFLTPLSVGDDDDVRVRTELERKGDEVEFRVCAHTAGDWCALVEGRLSRARDKGPDVDVDVDLAQAAAHTVTDHVFPEGDANVFRFGPRWDSVRRAWYGADATVGLIGSRDDVDDETHVYGLHPAKLDNAVNLISQDSGGTFLPYVYKEFIVRGPMPERFHTLIRTVRDDSANGETVTYDVDLIDLDGVTFASARDYTVKRVDWRRFRLGQRKYAQLNWVNESTPAARPGDLSWAVVVTDTDVGRRWASGAHSDGRDVVTITLADRSAANARAFTPDDSGMTRLCEELGRLGVGGVVFATDATSADGRTPSERRAFGVGALFEFTRAVLTSRLKLERLAVVGRLGQPIGSDETDPWSAATEALGVVVGQENPQLGVNVIDLGPDGDDEAEHCLRRHVVTSRALRDGRVLVPRVGHGRTELSASEGLYEGGSFLVTGGAGALGLAVADEMVRGGARRVVLCGRKGPDEIDRSRVETLGVVTYVRCDVGNPDDVRGLARRLSADSVRLDGIVHAAGVAGAGFLVNKARAAFDAVLRPKVDGALAMLELTSHHPGAFVVFFSSITAITGGQGQSDYCSANAFLDSLAARARSEGVHAVSINWPAWADIGMAADFGVDDSATPFRSLEVSAALQWMEHLVAHPIQHLVPAEINGPAMAELADEMPFVLEEEFSARPAARGASGEGAPASQVDVRLMGLSDPDQVQLGIAQVYARVLGFTEIDAFRSFQDMGGNSLMTAQLLKELDAIHPGVIDIADLFSYVTVESLAKYVSGQVGADEPPVAPAGGMDTELQEALDEIGDAELSGLFHDLEKTE